MLFGYDQGVMGSLLTGPSFEATFPSISNGNSTLQGFAVREDGARAVYSNPSPGDVLLTLTGGRL